MSTSEQWYYVHDNERVGPIDHDQMEALFQSKSLGQESYVWKKGFDNWQKAGLVSDFQHFFQTAPSLDINSIPTLPEENFFDWNNVDENQKIFMIKVGRDRGLDEEVEYGPFSLNMLKKAYGERRINGKTYIFVKGLKNWMFLADIPIYQETFKDEPPKINDTERRVHVRKPFVARVFFHDEENFFEGICRDVSVGGMQLLMSHYPGKVGDTVALNVHPDNTDYHFTADAQVVRILEGRAGISIRFKGLDADAQKSIQSYISHD